MAEPEAHRRPVDIGVTEGVIVGLGEIALEAVPRPVPAGGERVLDPIGNGVLGLAPWEPAGPGNRGGLSLKRVGDPGPGADHAYADIGLELVVHG